MIKANLISIKKTIWVIARYLEKNGETDYHASKNNFIFVTEYLFKQLNRRVTKGFFFAQPTFFLYIQHFLVFFKITLTNLHTDY